MQEPKISLFKHRAVTNPQNITVAQWVNIIKSDEVKATIQLVRRQQTKKEADNIKSRLPEVVIGGVFSGGHGEEHLVTPSGLMGLDFDGVADVSLLKARLKNDELTHVAFISPSGKGIKGAVKFKGDRAKAFETLRLLFLLKYGAELEKGTGYVSKKAYLSHDPDAYHNPKSAVFDPGMYDLQLIKEKLGIKDEPKPEPKPSPKPRKLSPTDTRTVADDVQMVVHQITMRRVDITGNYHQWLKIGFALASEFGEGGRCYFHDVSRFAESYDPKQTDKQYNSCLKAKGHGTGIGSFFQFAKENGIDIKPPTPEKQTKAPVKKVVKNVPVPEAPNIEAIEVQPADQSPAQTSPTGNAQDIPTGPVAKASETEAIEVTEDVPEWEKPIERNSKDWFNEHEEHGFYKKDGKYYVREVTKKGANNVVISNFLMEILYHFDDGSKDTKRLVKIQHHSGRFKNIEIYNSEASPDRFETILKSFGCSFLGSSYHLKKIFVMQMDNEGRANAINKLGYNPDFDIYALSDCVIADNKVIKANPIGILENNGQLFYLPAWTDSNVNSSDFANERRFRFIPGRLNLTQWMSLIYRAFGVNGAIGISYLMQSVFRDVVFKQTNFFPYLYLFGQAGVGKTTYIDMLLRLFGDKDPGISIKGSTTKALVRAAAQKTNAITYYKEYSNAVDSDFINTFKSLYDGTGYSIAMQTNDAKTKTFLAESGFIFDGNVLPTAETAFFDRMMVLTFELNRFTDDSTNAYIKLKEECENGFGLVLQEMLAFRPVFVEKYKAAFNAVYWQLKGKSTTYNGIDFEAIDINFGGINISRLPERTIQHVAFTIAPVYVLLGVFEFPFDLSEFVQKVLGDAVEKFDMMNELNSISVFWDAINFEAGQKQGRITHPVEGNEKAAHYLRDNAEKVLYIKIKELYPLYVDYCKKTMIQHEDIQTLRKMLTASNYPFIPNKTQGDRGQAYTKYGFGSCYRFSFELTGDRISIAGKEINLKSI